MAVDLFDLLHHRRPFRHIRPQTAKPQLAADDVAQALFFQQQRDFVEGGGGHIGNNAVLLHIAEKSDLMPDLLRDGGICPADQNIRLDPDGQQFLDRMLSRLAFQLPAAGDGYDKRHMDIQDIFPAHFRSDLPDRLQKRLAFDIPYGAADLADDHIGAAVLHGIDTALDLIGDVGDDLHRPAQIPALPLPVQHAPKNLAGGYRGVPVQRFIHEALVMSQVEVGFRPVIGDEYLPMLVGAHRTGVHIKIGVKLLVADPQAALLQQPAQRSRADSLA